MCVVVDLILRLILFCGREVEEEKINGTDQKNNINNRKDRSEEG